MSKLLWPTRYNKSGTWSAPLNVPKQRYRKIQYLQEEEDIRFHVNEMDLHAIGDLPNLRFFICGSIPTSDGIGPVNLLKAALY